MTTTTEQAVRIPLTLYRRAKQAAEQTGVSIEEFVRERLEEALGIDPSPDDIEVTGPRPSMNPQALALVGREPAGH